MKKLKSVLIGVLILEVVVLCVVSINIKKERKAEEERVANLWFNQYTVVAHAMGAIEGIAYTNSLEAFEYNYDQGNRIFEVDVALTSDKRLVLTHGWQEHKTERLGYDGANAEPMSYNQFMNSPILNQYTPLSSEDLIGLMQKYPDIYIVLDWGKDLDYVAEEDKDYIFELEDLIKRNELLINQFKTVDESLLKRVIPQIYYEDHYYALDKIYHFDNYIYTLYKNYENTTAKEVMTFVQKNKISVITTNLIGEQAILTREIKRQVNLDRNTSKKMGVFLHTINDIVGYDDYLKEGYKGIYTDVLNEDAVQGD